MRRYCGTYPFCKLHVVRSRAFHADKQRAKMAARKELCCRSIRYQRLVRLVLQLQYAFIAQRGRQEQRQGGTQTQTHVLLVERTWDRALFATAISAN
jgi:hypothetical protein